MDSSGFDSRFYSEMGLNKEEIKILKEFKLRPEKDYYFRYKDGKRFFNCNSSVDPSIKEQLDRLF